MASETNGTATEHAQGMPQLDFTTFPNQIFWLVVTLVVVYLILNKIALPRISSVLSQRHGTIARDLEQAEELKQKAEEAGAAYDAALLEARAEANRIVAEAKAEIQIELDAASAKADAEISAKASESEARIGEIRASAVKSVEAVAKEAAAEIVKAVMPSIKDIKSVGAAVTARMKG